ncbi:hypothetical protein DFH09DRAFT_1503716 [Mycena vulgaris]|nr:hypothetical protein DFH09DRAFT_1503716 [Mycena vulgaris]
MLIGCEGALSPARWAGSGTTVYNLLIDGMAVIQTLSRAQMERIRTIDLLMFQAINPDTKTFLWHSIQGHDTDSDTQDMLTNISYPIRDSHLPQDASDADIVVDMKGRMGGFAQCLQDLVAGIGPEAPVTRVHLRDWILVPYIQAGDAGGAMVMYRGEGHGILGAAQLAEAINLVYNHGGDAAKLLDDLSEEVPERRKLFTMLSRNAYIDAHDVVPAGSPLVRMDYPPPPSLAKIHAIHAASRTGDEHRNPVADTYSHRS